MAPQLCFQPMKNFQLGWFGEKRRQTSSTYNIGSVLVRVWPCGGIRLHFLKLKIISNCEIKVYEKQLTFNLIYGHVLQHSELWNLAGCGIHFWWGGNSSPPLTKQFISEASLFFCYTQMTWTKRIFFAFDSVLSMLVLTDSLALSCQIILALSSTTKDSRVHPVWIMVHKCPPLALRLR